MRLLFVASGAVLAASLLLGGAARRGIVGDVLPILMSCGLIAFAYPVARLRLQEYPFFRILLAGALLLLVVQFIPLPPSLWGALPGRGELLEMYAQSGVAPPWASLAIRPGEAARSALSILPGLAICLAVIDLDVGERQKLALIVIAAALVSAPLGMLQILGGLHSPLYFFEITNRGSAVGFFANRNHYAALFYSALPFVAALFASKKQMAGAPLWMLGAAAGFVIVLGLSLSGSRSALILGAAAIVASVLYVARGNIRELIRGRFAQAGVAIAAIFMIPLTFGVGLLTILQRFDIEDLAEDGRWTFANVTMDAIRSHFPVGAGLGSFEQIYQLHEPAGAVIAPIINHAHNDWLEIGLEMGLPGWGLAAAFLVWLATSFIRTAAGDQPDSRLTRAALVAIALLTVHSIWDYPLRTIALSALFGLCCGLTLRAGESRAPERRRRRGRRGSSRTAAARAARPA